MWHIFRAIYWVIFKQPTAGLFDRIAYHTWVKPWDLDSNVHLTNSRYFRYMDLGRLECFLLTGVIHGFAKTKVKGVVANSEISYIRELRPFTSFRIETQLLGWDEKYLYFDQQFMVKDKVHASSMSRVCPIYQGKPLAPQRMFEMMGQSSESPELPTPAVRWKQMLDSKKPRKPEQLKEAA